MDVVTIAVDKEGAIEQGRIAVAEDRDSGPTGILPTWAARTLYVSMALEDLVLGAGDVLDVLDLSIRIEV